MEFVRIRFIEVYSNFTRNFKTKIYLYNVPILLIIFQDQTLLVLPILVYGIGRLNILVGRYILQYVNT